LGSCYKNPSDGDGCIAGAGEAPFRICSSVDQCLNYSYCERDGDYSVVLLGAPECIESVCEWKMKSTVACSGNGRCYGVSCSGGGTVSSGVTSGGFPWMGTGGAAGSSNTEAGVSEGGPGRSPRYEP
jgi:hypothetical protein